MREEQRSKRIEARPLRREAPVGQEHALHKSAAVPRPGSMQLRRPEPLPAVAVHDHRRRPRDLVEAPTWPMTSCHDNSHCSARHPARDAIVVHLRD